MKKKHIEVLIIEDSPADYKLAELLLKESSEPSFGIRHAVRLGEALKMLVAEPFDIILMDLDLPDSSGLDGLRKITEKLDGPPVVVLTGLEDEAVGLAALRNGASDFLIKGRLTLNSLIRSLLYALTRQEMEKKLLAEQRNLQTIFDSVNVGLLLINENGVVQRANPVIRRWVGKEPGEMVSAQPGDILGCAYALGDPAGCGHTPHCWTCSIHKTFETALSSGQSLHDVETEAIFLIGRDQVRLYLSLSADPVFIDGKRHVILSLNNITDRKYLESALRNKTVEQQAILDASPAMIFYKDKENRFIRVNKAFAEAMELPKEKLEGTSILDLYPREQAEAFGKDDQEVILSGKAKHNIIEPMRTPRGTRIVQTEKIPFLDDQGVVVGIIGFSIDITERRQAEAALQASEKSLARSQEIAHLGNWRLDIDRNILTWSDENYRIFGLPNGTPLTYETFLEIVHPSDREYVESRWKAGLAGEPYDIEHRIVVNGQVKWVREKAYLEFDGAKKLIGGVGITQDITERKKAEEALMDLAYAKSKFAATVAHELRSPLATIKAITELVLDGSVGPVNDEQKDLLGIANESIARLGRLTNNVLAFKKIEAGKSELDLREMDINTLVRNAHKSATLFAGNRKSDLVMDLGDDLPTLEIDSDKILQVLINLINNAVLYSEKGAVVIRTRRENGEMHVSVADSGSGIAAEHLEKIFEPFAQAGDSKKGGTGLGLAIVKEIVLAHRGRIWAESPPKDGSVRGSVAEKVGKGSVFHFTLPL